MKMSSNTGRTTGKGTKELIIKGKLYEVLGDEKEVERIFPIVKQQGEY
jgi:hypothetical protein